MAQITKHPGQLLFFGNPEVDSGFIEQARAFFASVETTIRPNELEDRILSGSVNVIVLSSILSSARQSEILSSLNSLTPVRPVILLALTDSLDRNTALRLMESGADALVVPPSSQELLADVMKRAEAQRLKRIVSQGAKNVEHCTSLQWIVERVADRLSDAANICSSNPDLAQVESSNKAIQEVLLAVLGSEGPVDEKLLKRLLVS